MPRAVVVKSRLPAIAAKLPATVSGGVERAAHMIAEEAKRRAPEGQPPEDPHPGRLKESIRAVEIDDDWYVIADARAGDERQGAPYAHMVEFGSVHNAPPHPFLIPALEADRVKALIVVGAVLKSL